MGYKLKELNNKVFTIDAIYPGQYVKFGENGVEKKDSVTPAEKAEKNQMGYSAWSFQVGAKVTLDGNQDYLNFSYSQLKSLKGTADVEKDEELVGLSFKVKVETGARTVYTFSLKSSAKVETKKEEPIDLDDIAF